MVKVILEASFQKTFSKIKDCLLKERVIKQISKIKNNPEIGKPMRYGRRGTRELYIKPFRLSYSYNSSILKVYILDLYHKKRQ